MCEFCTQHGEGKKWYLNIENYLEERLSDEQKLTTRGQHENVEHGAAEFWTTANAADNPDESVRLFFEEMKKKEWGQVIPMEDVENIFDMSLNIVRSPCVCRIALRGAKEYRACFKVVASPSQFWKDMFDELPDMSRDMDVVSCEEAIGSVLSCKLSFNSLLFSIQLPILFLHTYMNDNKCKVFSCH